MLKNCLDGKVCVVCFLLWLKIKLWKMRTISQVPWNKTAGFYLIYVTPKKDKHEEGCWNKRSPNTKHFRLNVIMIYSDWIRFIDKYRCQLFEY